MQWKILSQTVTASGDPTEFAVGLQYGNGGEWVEGGEQYPKRWLVVAAERVGGGNDDYVPRRCLGIGDTRASARRSLEDTIRRYDPMGKVVPAR